MGYIVINKKSNSKYFAKTTACWKAFGRTRNPFGGIGRSDAQIQQTGDTLDREGGRCSHVIVDVFSDRSDRRVTPAFLVLCRTQ